MLIPLASFACVCATRLGEKFSNTGDASNVVSRISLAIGKTLSVCNIPLLIPLCGVKKDMNRMPFLTRVKAISVPDLKRKIKSTPYGMESRHAISSWQLSQFCVFFASFPRGPSFSQPDTKRGMLTEMLLVQNYEQVYAGISC